MILQLSSVLEVIPGWLPSLTIAAGFSLLSIGMAERYLHGYFGHWEEYSRPLVLFASGCLAASVAGATYVTIRTHDLDLLFVLFIFAGGRFVQGAISARLLQRILNWLFVGTSSSKNWLRRAYEYVASKLRERLVVLLATGLVTTYTFLSIAAVFVLGSGAPTEAIERFWIGTYFLVVIGLVYDFRHFAHRISWTAAIGLLVATAGAVLYSPVGFSSFTDVIAPYLDTPIADWMRWPLGAIGFLFGVVFWGLFYVKSIRRGRHS